MFRGDVDETSQRAIMQLITRSAQVDLIPDDAYPSARIELMALCDFWGLMRSVCLSSCDGVFESYMSYMDFTSTKPYSTIAF